LLAQTLELFIVHLSSFLGGRSHEHVFFVQKLPWLAMEQLAPWQQKTFNFFAARISK
jgi:hypothetical protein